MRKRTILGILFLAVTLAFPGYSQKQCKVLLPALQGIYKGKCKHGLAHGNGIAKGKDFYQGHFKNGYPDGEGTYIWADSSKYTGHWKKGKRSGKGSFTFKIHGKDSTLAGIWKNDQYIGKEVKKPVVIVNKYVDSYEFINMEGAHPQVLIRFMQNGTDNTRVENVMMSSSSGFLVKRGRLTGFDNVTFPVTISVRYNTYNKLGTWVQNCFFEFSIFEPGDWMVVLKN